MDFKAFILCFAFFVVTASGSPLLCSCAQDEPKDTVSKYNLKIKEGNQEIDETIEINTDKETEKISIPSNGDNSQSAPGEVDVVFDFKLNLTMHRLSNQKACFLSNSTHNLPKPADLNKLLETESSPKIPTEEHNYMAVGTLDDRSILSDQMAHLCAKLPIYRVKAILRTDADKATSGKRQKRLICYYRYRPCCTWRYVRCCTWYCYRPGCCSWDCFYHWVKDCRW